ncbi:MAG: hypothetical protein U0235_21105 [Polyangiaceae bacterium]
MFHEIFHLNDAARGDCLLACSARTTAPSSRSAGPTYVASRHTRPAARSTAEPTAFQPDNGVSVREYGAELALRWYREQRAIVRGEPVKRSSAAAENARAWRAVDEFFHVDRVPACP